MKTKQVLLCLFGAGMIWAPSMSFASSEAGIRTTNVAVPDNKVVNGTVIDADGPLIGATVKVAGTTSGTVTDFDGKFAIKCSPGATLEFSYVGYKTITAKAKEGMNVMMEADGKVLNEVVVTALGVKRDRKALGYGLSEVKGEELTKAKETNVINSLSLARWLVSWCRTLLVAHRVPRVCSCAVTQK